MIEGPTEVLPLYQFHDNYEQLPDDKILVVYDIRAKQAPAAVRYLLVNNSILSISPTLKADLAPGKRKVCLSKSSSGLLALSWLWTAPLIGRSWMPSQPPCYRP